MVQTTSVMTRLLDTVATQQKSGDSGYSLLITAPESPVRSNESYSSTGANVIVALFDTGIDLNHSQLTNVWSNLLEIAGDGSDGNRYVDDFRGFLLSVIQMETICTGTARSTATVLASAASLMTPW